MSGSQLSSYLSGVTASSETQSVISSLSHSIQSSLQSQGFSGTQTGVATLTTTLPDGNKVTATATAEADGGILNATHNSRGLPTYAIVLICVLGFLALVLALAAAYLLWRWYRRNRALSPAAAQGVQESINSTSPMLKSASGQPSEDSHDPQHSLGPPVGPAEGPSGHSLAEMGMSTALLGAGTAGAAAGTGAGVGVGARAAGQASYDHQGPTEQENNSTVWSDEASRMADAFRNALRQPSFAGSDEPQNGSTSHLLPATTTTTGVAMMPNASSASIQPSSVATAQQSPDGRARSPVARSTDRTEDGDGNAVRDERPTLAQLLRQELARDGMQMHGVGQVRPRLTSEEGNTSSGQLVDELE